jgi:hypothetical protein
MVEIKIAQSAFQRLVLMPSVHDTRRWSSEAVIIDGYGVFFCNGIDRQLRFVSARATRYLHSRPRSVASLKFTVLGTTSLG